MNAISEFADGLCFVKDLFYEKSSLVFSVYHIVVVTQTLNLKFLLGDNFLISFQFDTFFFRIVQFSRYNRSSAGCAG